MSIRPTTSSTAVLQGPVIDLRSGALTPTALQWFLSVQRAVNNGLTSQGTFIGNIDPTVTVGNRTEGIGTDLQNIDSDGIILPNGIDFERAYINKNTDHIADGTGSPLAGGKEAYTALIASAPAAHDSLVFDGTKWAPAQVDYADLTGKPTLPATAVPVTHNWLNSYNSMTGAFAESQPAFADISGQVTTAQLPASGLTVTITTAKLTTGGTNGSMTFTNGILTAQTPAT